MAKISVLIPTYKPGDYIIPCLRSIELQILDKSKFKVYIALNGSDRSFETYLQKELENFTFQYELFFLKEAGVSNARNFLIDSSIEDFVVFVDDDDLLSENYLEELLKICSEGVMAVSNIHTFKKSLESLIESYRNYSYYSFDDNEYRHWKSRKYFSAPWAKMIHRNDIGNIRQDTNLKLGEDSLFLAHISKNIKSVAKTSEDVFYYVNERLGSSSRKAIDKRSEILRIKYLVIAYMKLFFNSEYQKTFILTRVAATVRNLRRLI